MPFATGMVRAPARVGLIGAGRMGALHCAKLALHANARLCAILDHDAARAAALAAAHGVRSFGAIGEFLACVDAVIIATSPDHHARLAVQCLAAGKAVLVEKPLAMNATDAHALLREARLRGSVLRVGHSERFCAVYRRVRPLLEAARHIRCERFVLAHIRNRARNPVFDLMIHDLDLVLQAKSCTVSTLSATALPDLDGRRGIAAQLGFADGSVAHFAAGYVRAEARRSLRADTAEGVLDADWGARALFHHDSPQRVPVYCANAEESDVLTHEHADFFAACAGTAPKQAGVSGAVAAVECAEAIELALCACVP